MKEEFQQTRAAVLPVEIHSEHSSCPMYAMVDSGCQGYAFIDTDWAREKGIPLLPIQKPFSLVGYDGEKSETRTVDLYTQVSLRTGDYYEKNIILYSTYLAYYPVILGLPWLEKYNPCTGWAKRLLSFDSEYC